MTLETDEAQTPSFSTAMGPLLILALAMAAGFAMMGSFSMIQESAKAEMGLSDQVLGVIQGVSAAVPLVLFSVPIGILVDRANRIRLLLLLGIVWTAGTALTAFSENVPVLFAARMMTGIGTTGALTAALSLAADLCPPGERGRAILIVTLGKTLGQAAAFGLAGWLLGLFFGGFALPWLGALAPWRATHVALALVSLACLFPLLLLHEPMRREVAAGNDAPLRVVAGELWQRRAFLIPLFIGQVSVVMADAAAAIWASPVLSRGYGLAPQDFAGWMGMLIFLSGAIGSVLGGFVADIGQSSGRRGGILIGAVAAAAIGIPSALFPIMPTTGSFAVALGSLMFCGTITGLVTSVALTVLIPNELRGLCIGAFIAIAGLIGFGIAPSLVTWISVPLGCGAHLGEALALVGVVVSSVSVLAFAIAMRQAPSSVIRQPI